MDHKAKSSQILAHIGDQIANHWILNIIVDVKSPCYRIYKTSLLSHDPLCVIGTYVENAA